MCVTPRPVLSWVDGTSRAAIVRCAQPLVGITGQKSPADERLFVHMSMCNPNDRRIAMLDARPYMNAVANKARKGGFEDISRYDESDAR